MAALATGNLEPTTISRVEEPEAQAHELGSTALLDIVRACLHANSAEWIFLRELRVGTGFRNGAAQRLDAFALNCFAHTSMKRVCYELKTSRADFLCEMKQPLKRRIGLRYSNEFYFVTPAGLLNSSEIPIECGLVEIGLLIDEERKSMLARAGAFSHFDVDHSTYCRVTVPAPGEKRRADMAILCRYAEEPAKSISGKASKAAEPATATVSRLNYPYSRFVRPYRGADNWNDSQDR